MLSFIVALGLSTLSFTTAAVSPSSLAVSITPIANTVGSIDDVTLSAIISNPTTEDIKVLKYGTVLDDLPVSVLKTYSAPHLPILISHLQTRSFVVTKGGKNVEFTGIRVSLIYLASRYILLNHKRPSTRSVWTRGMRTHM